MSHPLSGEYDDEFRRRLADAVMRTIVDHSRVAGGIVAMRPIETANALCDATIMVLTMLARMDDPGALNAASKRFAKRIRHEVGQGRAAGWTDRIGGGKAGHA
jgi:hypothetical protein